MSGDLFCQKCIRRLRWPTLTLPFASWTTEIIFFNISSWGHGLKFDIEQDQWPLWDDGKVFPFVKREVRCRFTTRPRRSHLTIVLTIFLPSLLPNSLTTSCIKRWPKVCEIHDVYHCLSPLNWRISWWSHMAFVLQLHVIQPFIWTANVDCLKF